MDMHLQTMTELAAGLKNGEFTSVELTQALLDRINAHGESLNAFITVTADEAWLKRKEVPLRLCRIQHGS